MTIPKPPSQPGCKWVEECIESCEASSVYVLERGVGATFINPRHNRIRKIHFDGCYGKARGTKQADYIVGVPDFLDIIVELKGSDTNLKAAALQVESTLETWRADPRRFHKIACLIIHGRIEGKKKRAGRVPRMNSMKDAIQREFVRKYKVLLWVRESGERQFSFNDFLRNIDAS